jgi:DNA-binding Lrp family transcriptional regulator
MANESIVLAKVKVGKVDGVMAILKKYKEVKMIASTAGHYDLIITVSTDSLEKLHDFVTKIIHSIDGVESTETHIIAKKVEK